ncbi:MAG TPA: histidine--tRNA ligase [Planctomycetota bacterium]|nr:histidine--tRNA ligase [Planctomycetota bacterium]
MSTPAVPRRPDGTQDLLPDQVAAWRRLEAAVLDVFERYGYLEVRPPLFENTALFHKSTGETTDIVEKQMFTVPSRAEGGESFTFRPEFTPGVIRLILENQLLKQKPCVKVWYSGPVFRYERPQKGRYRQFHQFGVEAVGSNDPLLDVETIAAFARILGKVGVTDYAIRINSMGCANCRPAYREALRAFIEPNLASYCENCRRRFDRNVFRILDCKVPADRERNEKAPPSVDSLDAPCRDHFAAVQRGLEAAGLAFAVDKRIVRGLDYYTRTVYEFSSARLGAQDALGGGGRYDGLVAQTGGPDVGAVGFSAGSERVLLAMDPSAADGGRVDFYAVAADDASRTDVFKAAQALRAADLAGDLDFEGRSMKAQMRSANKAGAKFAVIVGSDERAQGRVRVKPMEGGEERVVTLDEAVRIVKGDKR